jgi:N5-(cytidine 5'-diphosphoramidyl)-L-glutamine hydrolase
MSRRIGLTMRVVDAVGYSEPRDALAQDWSTFMALALPEVNWLPIPNIGAAVASYLSAWEIDGILLTGGEDIGKIPLRDETEAAAIDYALGRDFPVFGVCRGLQMIQTYFGGPLAQAEREMHVATRHAVRFISSGPDPIETGTVRTVNSFHGQAVAIANLATPLRPFAVSDDDLAEGIFHPELSVTAVQWHPERGPLETQDRDLLRTAFSISRYIRS